MKTNTTSNWRRAGRFHRAVMLWVGSVLLAGSVAFGAAEEPFKPVMRIPKMAQPPVIDGKIDEKEWAGASAFTGFIPINHFDQYPADMKRVVYLGYDDKNLYLAMDYSMPKDVIVNAQTKNMEDCDNETLILFGDHLEIQISPQTVKRDRATKTGFGFYKIIVNPFDVFSDYWHNCDTPGNESGWSSGAVIKSSTDQHTWRLEMAIPIVGTMKGIDGDTIRKTDGLELIMQLVPYGNAYPYGFGCWRPGVWYAWDEFYKVTLDPQAPVMQFFDTSSLIQGDLDLNVRMRGSPGQSADVSVRVVDVDNQPVFDDTRRLTLKAADWSAADFRKPSLNVPAFLDKHKVEAQSDVQRNHLFLRIESDGKAVYTAELPFAKHTPDFTDRTYGAFKRLAPKGDYVTQIAYIRNNGKFRVTVNTDVLGDFPQAIRDATLCRVRVQEAGNGATLLDKKLPLQKGLGTELYELGKRAGKFEATIDILDGKGGVVSTRKHLFENKDKYVWENNTIGKERVVIPPWRPIAFEGNALKTRTAKFTVGSGGLWDAVEVLDKPLLTGPMRIEGSVDGKEVAWKGDSANIEKGKGRAFPPEFDQYDYKVSCPKIPFDQLPETDGYEAVVTGKGEAGPIAVSVKSVMDFDGATRHFIEYGPKDGKPVKVDRLEVVCELPGAFNGLTIMREIVPSLLSLPTDKQGVLWESSSFALKPMNFRGTFLPFLKIGDGKYSLQFFAKSDKGWLLDDKVSCVRIERRGDKVQLRLLLVNAPAMLSAPRTVDFVLLPMPSRVYPKDSRYLSWCGEGREYINVACGWRKFGTGCDNWYLPTDEEYAELYAILARGGTAFGTSANTKLLGKVPLQIYSSVVAVGAPLPDCDSFKGQWYKDSDYDPGKGHKIGQYGPNAKTPTGHPLDKPECFSEARPSGGWDEDLNDNYMWFYRKLAALSHANGINHWDNGLIFYHLNLDAGTYGYVRDDGRKQSESTVYQRWSLMKRNYVMQWLEGKPPFHNEMLFSYHNVNRYCEGPYYVWTEDGTLFDNFADLAALRMGRMSSDTPAHVVPDILWAKSKGMSDRTAQRSYLALMVLHDYGLVGIDTTKAPPLCKMDEEIGFLDREKQAEFIPYWESHKLLQFVAWKDWDKEKTATWSDWKPKDVYVSIYRSKTKPGKAMLWFVNAGDKMVTTGIRLDAKALVGRPRADIILRNMENPDQVDKRLPPTVKDATDRETLWGNIDLPPRDYRAVIVEPGTFVPKDSWW